MYLGLSSYLYSICTKHQRMLDDRIIIIALVEITHNITSMIHLSVNMLSLQLVQDEQLPS